MTCNDQQVIWLRKMAMKNTQKNAAVGSNMSVRTARKYLSTHKLPSELRGNCKRSRSKKHMLLEVWPEIVELLIKSPKLHAKTILAYLIDKYERKYTKSHLRSLQRIILDWRRTDGPNKEIIFSQDILPGKQSQSDYTHMKDLAITIDGKAFDHLLFHFMLPYSNWEHVTICYSESFESLSQGYDEAVWTLGGVTLEHRTDNLSAAAYFKDKQRHFTQGWQEVMQHYNVTPTCNNPGVSHENGSVEKSHDLIKTAIDQQLALRGTRNFSTIIEYKEFLHKLTAQRNLERKELINIERQLLKPLPISRYSAPLVMDVTVVKFSTVRLLKASYSVPSRLIGCRLRACIYQEQIDLYYGDKLIQSMPKVAPGEDHNINYRHMIASLVRKPGAFANYCYRESFFPTPVFRRAYDVLKGRYLINHDKQYLQILLLASTEGESKVEKALEELLLAKIVPEINRVKALINPHNNTVPEIKVVMPVLSNYDMLIANASNITVH